MGPSKQHIIWHFTIDTVIHKVELFDSIFTGRRRVKIDNQETVDTGRVGFFGNEKFSYLTNVSEVSLEIIEGEDCFILNLNNIPFSQLYLKEKQQKREAKFSRKHVNKAVAKQFFEEEHTKYKEVLEREKNLQRCVEVEIDLGVGGEEQVGVMATPFDFDEE